MLLIGFPVKDWNCYLPSVCCGVMVTVIHQRHRSMGAHAKGNRPNGAHGFVRLLGLRVSGTISVIVPVTVMGSRILTAANRPLKFLMGSVAYCALCAGLWPLVACYGKAIIAGKIQLLLYCIWRPLALPWDRKNILGQMCPIHQFFIQGLPDNVSFVRATFWILLNSDVLGIWARIIE